jgi:erythronate-4-phosphate dehydrogenase
MIIVDDQLPIVSRILGQVADVLCVDGRAIDRDLLMRTGAAAIFIRTVTQVSEELLEGTSVRFVASASAGFDHIDDAARCRPGTTVVHAPGCNAQAVAEYVMTWLTYFGVQSCETLGVVGFGNVGSLVARLALQSGRRVMVNDPPLADMGYVFPSVVTHTDLETLLRNSDVVTLHVPYTESGVHPTKGLIKALQLDLLSSGATIINTSRGGIVDEAAVLQNVNSGRLRAVLDVFCGEPDVDADVIRSIPYCTPHIAGYSETAKVRASRMVLKAYRQWSGLEFEIPEQYELVTRVRRAVDDASVIIDHPFRDQWLSAPSSDTFAACRRLTPLRGEHLHPPTWEELHVLRD